MNRLQIMLASVLVGAGFILPQTVRAHCDTMNGPVVMASKAALEKKDVTPVLKWVKKDAEHNVEAGRAFVAAYVEYVHYVEGLHRVAQGAGAHHAEAQEAAPAKDAHAEPVPQHKH